MQPVEISRILFNQFITSLAFKGDPALHTSPGPSAVSVPKQARMGWNRMKSEQQNAAKASVTWSPSVQQLGQGRKRSMVAQEVPPKLQLKREVLDVGSEIYSIYS